MEKQRVADAALARLKRAERQLSFHGRYLAAQSGVEKELTAARKTFEEARGRFRSKREKTLVILSAPDQLKLVDVPQIPKRPTTSALKILIAGVAAGIGLGCGLAVLAEQLDQSVRGEEDLAGETDMPVLARLPRLRDEEKEALSFYGHPSGAPPRLAEAATPKPNPKSVSETQQKTEPPLTATGQSASL